MSSVKTKAEIFSARGVLPFLVEIAREMSLSGRGDLAFVRRLCAPRSRKIGKVICPTRLGKNSVFTVRFGGMTNRPFK
ncbi:hypothetical protein, partial [Bradyrhizobium sp. SZCCHNR2028]|uniref:hypothetical protein n=1 Tax=Bradyrhizobium sp. SZCCHNR2028 TaxID=3057382 RepID=UPI0028E2F32F